MGLGPQLETCVLSHTFTILSKRSVFYLRSTLTQWAHSWHASQYRAGLAREHVGTAGPGSGSVVQHAPSVGGRKCGVTPGPGLKVTTPARGRKKTP